jgi:glycosyltransferase involved in cell wall biosynthesis
MAERPLAFVVQRYGPEIVGGSESLCRAVAEMIATQRPVEVLTSCAKDYMTWRNEYPAGTSTLNGVTLRRFPVDFERDHRFHDVFGSILGGLPFGDYGNQKELMRAVIARSPVEQQLDCLRLQGPYASPLLEYLAEHHEDYEQIVFFTYLYSTTFFGMQKVPTAKTVLVPTAHDEPPIFMPVFRDMLAQPPAYIFLTPEERHFIEGSFDVQKALRTTIGMPVELPAQADPARFRQHYGIDGPFLLYAGRIDPAKGCDELFRFFQAARSHLPPDLQLVVVGNRTMEIPRDPRIHYLGRVSDQDKVDAMAAASVMINSSHFESFSIVILEAMLCQTPVLVNGRCEVLKGHIERSKSGLYYTNYPEFVEALRLLLADERLRARMGTNGAEYVRQNYSYESVKQRYTTFLAQAKAYALHDAAP